MPATKKQIGIGVGIAVAVLAVGGVAVATLLSALSTPTTIAEPKPIHSSSSPSGSSTPGSTGTSKATPAPRASSPGTNPGGGNLIDNYLGGGGNSTTPGGNRVVPVEVIPGGGNQSVVIAPPVVNPVDLGTNPGGNTGGGDNGNGNGSNTGGGDNGNGNTGGGDNGGGTGGGDNGGGTDPTPNPTPTPDPTPTTDPTDTAVVTTQKAFLERYGESPEGKTGFTRGELISSEEIAPLVADSTSMPKFPELTPEQKAEGYEAGWVIEPVVNDPTKVKVSWYLYSPPAGEEPKSTIEQAAIAYQEVVNKAYSVTNVKNHFGEPGYRCSLKSYGWGTQPSTVNPPKGIPIDSLRWNLRLSLNGENWNVEWYICEPDEGFAVNSASALSAPAPTVSPRF